MKNRKVLFFSTVMLLLSLVFAIPALAGDYSDYLDRVMDLVQERYYQDVTDEELLEGALKGIFDNLDPYTTFFNMQEASSFMESMEGNYQGIGVEITEVPEGVMIMRVFSNSPAESAGLLANDLIVLVDGKNIGGMTATEAASLIRGESGTFVELGILRGTSSEPIFVKVQRAVVNISPVTWRVEGDIMVIRLESFSGNSAYFFEQALKEMDKRGIKKMILDLRNNPGGEVSQAVSIARLLVHKGLITKLDFKSEKSRDYEYYSYLAKAKYIPAVLVNGNTASASEILASAIQDSEDGFLIGTKTYGKGVFQNMYPILKPEAYEKYKKLYGESIVDGYEWINEHGVNIQESDLIGWTKITTGHYLTRAGKIIHGIGITPNLVVEDYELVNGIDINSVNSLESAGDIPLNGVSNDVYNMEKILTIKGYEVDTPDNILDSKSSEALKKFQKDSGIPTTGILDKATKEKLNSELGKLRLSIDRQYAKAIEFLKIFR